LSAISRRNKGFTLLEVLIAVVLLGILAAALYGSYFTVLKARERSAEGMEERRELGNTLDLLRREINSALYTSNDKRLKFIVEDRDSFGRPASNLELTTLAPPSPLGGGGKESGVIDVQYYMLEKEKETEKQQLILARKEQDILLESTTVPAYPQMERINSFQVECSNDGSKWVKSWDATLNNGLPKIVRITVQLEEQEGQLVAFSVYAAPRIAGQ
jgi:general secretion pathway protein J